MALQAPGEGYENLSDRLKRENMEVTPYIQVGSQHPEQGCPTGDVVFLVTRVSGAIVCRCATLGEVRAFLIGYRACRKAVRDLCDDDAGGP